jgi:hypothetical protein
VLCARGGSSRGSHGVCAWWSVCVPVGRGTRAASRAR